MNPTNDEVNDTLRRLESPRIEFTDDPPPPWTSIAERDGLPLVNRVDSGAPLLKVDEVLKWQPGHMGRK